MYFAKIMWQNFQIHLASAGKLFCQLRKWADVMLRQECLAFGHLGPLLLKSGSVRGWILLHKLFKGYIFCFQGHSVGQYKFELLAHERNLRQFVKLWFFIIWNHENQLNNLDFLTPQNHQQVSNHATYLVQYTYHSRTILEKHALYYLHFRGAEVQLLGFSHFL